MPTLKEYLEEQRKAGETPYFTNVPGEDAEGAFRYGEEEFTAETERMLEDPGGGFTYTENLPEGLVPRARPQLPEEPTAETVKPGGEIPEAYRKEHGLSAEARWAIDQKIPEAKAVPKKPTEQELSPDFKDRGKFRDHVAKKIEGRLGVNPLTYNYLEEAEAKTKDKEPDLFRAFWGGKKAYHMKELLNPQEKQMWEKALGDFAAKNEGEAKILSDQVNKELTFGMKMYDDIQGEKRKLPEAVRDAISPMYITYEDGKKQGNIPAGVEPNAIRIAEALVNQGMSAPEAVDKMTQALMKENFKEQNKRIAVDDALSGIPDPGRWKSAADRAAAKTAAQSALDAGGTEDEIKNRLLDRGWDEKDIAKILPSGPIAAADVSRETAKNITKLDSPDAIRKAWKAGDFGPPESKEARAKAKELLTPFHKG